MEKVRIHLVSLMGSLLMGCFLSQAAPVSQDVMELQICLERHHFSCNLVDGKWGAKTQRALATYCAVKGIPFARDQTNVTTHQFFPFEKDFWASYHITTQDVKSLVKIPFLPADKAKLSAMGYQTLVEMIGEWAHCSHEVLAFLNPQMDLGQVRVGDVLRVPWVMPSRLPALKRWPYGHAEVLRISLAQKEITVFDEKGKFLAYYPCSIAADKKKRPPVGEIFVQHVIAHPNYTYQADKPDAQGVRAKYIFPPGPNNPVGVAWLGLSIPTYGIHGTAYPDGIGRAESHGCFRLSNWNAEKLRLQCEEGTRVVIE